MNTFSSDNYIQEITQYTDSIYYEVIEKLKKGTKRILIAMPVGFGKTTLLTRIAKHICPEYGDKAVFIVSMKVNEEFLRHHLSRDLPQMSIVTYNNLKKHNFDEILNAGIIFVDTLLIADRRELTIKLKDFSGIVITTSNVPFESQEAIHE